MKNVAIIAVILGIIGNAAVAESAINDAPNFALALGNNTAAAQWAIPKPAARVSNKAVTSKIEQGVARSMEQFSIELDKQLEAKMTQEIEYARH